MAACLLLRVVLFWGLLSLPIVTIVAETTLHSIRIPSEITTLKYFGAMNFKLNVTQPIAVMSTQRICHCATGPCAVSGESDRGVVAIQLALIAMPCSLEQMYLQLIRAGATAVLLNLENFGSPGITYFLHDGTSLASDRSMPILEMGAPESFTQDSNSESGLLVTPTLRCNQWRSMFLGWAWILTMRIGLATIFFAASRKAFVNLTARLRSYGQKWSVPNVVLCVESVTCAVLAVVAALGAFYSSDLLSTPAHNYFSSGLMGNSVFTTLAMLFYWNDQRKRVVARWVPATRDQERLRMLILASVTIVPDVFLSISCALYVPIWGGLGGPALGGLLSLVQFAVAVFFIFKLWQASVGFCVALRTLDGSTPSIDKRIVHLGLWLGVSGVAMLAYCAGTVVYVFVGDAPGFFGVSISIASLSRTGASYAQV